MYNKTKLVISSKEKQQTIIKDVYVGLRENPKAKAMASHRGRDATRKKISNRFFWHNIKVVHGIGAEKRVIHDFIRNLMVITKIDVRQSKNVVLRSYRSPSWVP